MHRIPRIVSWVQLPYSKASRLETFSIKHYRIYIPFPCITELIIFMMLDFLIAAFRFCIFLRLQFGYDKTISEKRWLYNQGYNNWPPMLRSKEDASDCPNNIVSPWQLSWQWSGRKNKHISMVFYSCSSSVVSERMSSSEEQCSVKTHTGSPCSLFNNLSELWKPQKGCLYFTFLELPFPSRRDSLFYSL